MSNPTCYPNLQLATNWTTQADSSGAHGTCVLTPGTLSCPQKVTFTPAKRESGQLWDNAYILHRNAASAATLFAYCIELTFPTQQDIDNCNAPELDFQMNDGQHIFNWGYQFLIGTGLRIWNRSVGAWVKSPVCQFPPFVPGVPLRIVVMHSRTAESVLYNGVALNGTWIPLTDVMPVVAKQETPYLNCAWQLDSKGQGAPISCWMDNCSVIGY